MLFTNFLKNHSKGKENNRDEQNNQEEVCRPQETGVISNIKDRVIMSEIGSKQIDDSSFTDNESYSGSRLCKTMSRMKLGLDTRQYSPEKSYNPLHRLELRKSQARERSRQSRIVFKIGSDSSGCRNTENDIPEEPHKLCINCDKFIPSSCIPPHEKYCVGFEKLLQMSKQDLFMFVHNKIASCQVKLDQVQLNTKKGTVIGSPTAIIADLYCRIAHLHRVRNAIMVKLH